MLPTNRKLKTIEQIFGDVKIGGTPAREKKEFFGGGLPWVSIRDMGTQRVIFETSETLSKIGVQNSNVKLISKGSLLFSFKLTVGRMCFAGVDLYTNEAIAAFEPNKEIDLNYLYYLLPSISQQVDRTNNYGAPLLNKSVIKSLKIPLSPLPVQHKIVAFLDEASAQITASKSAIQSQLDVLDQLWQSSLSEAMNNKIGILTKLGTLCDFVRGPFGGSLKKEIFKPDGYAIYEQQHAIYNQFSEIRYFIDENKFNEMKRFELKNGDLIMSCSGTMGKIAIVPEGIKQGIINQALLKLTPGEKINSTFLKLWMQSENFQNNLQEYSQGAAIQNVASVAILKQIQIPLPDLTTQTHIVSQLDDLNQNIAALRSQYTTQLQHFDDLRASILDQAFKGELVEE